MECHNDRIIDNYRSFKNSFFPLVLDTQSNLANLLSLEQ